MKQKEIIEVGALDIWNSIYIGWGVFFNQEKNLSFKEENGKVEVGSVGDVKDWAISEEQVKEVEKAILEFKRLRDEAYEIEKKQKGGGSGPSFMEEAILKVEQEELTHS